MTVWFTFYLHARKTITENVKTETKLSIFRTWFKVATAWSYQRRIHSYYLRVIILHCLLSCFFCIVSSDERILYFIYKLQGNRFSVFCIKNWRNPLHNTHSPERSKNSKFKLAKSVKKTTFYVTNVRNACYKYPHLLEKAKFE